MSNHYGYYCENCRKYSRHWFNHGDDFLRELYKNRLQFYDILRTIERSSVGDVWLAEKSFYEEKSGYVEGTTPLRWLRKHEGDDHSIYLTNEYYSIYEPLSEGAPLLSIEAMRTRREEGFW